MATRTFASPFWVQLPHFEEWCDPASFTLLDWITVEGDRFQLRLWVRRPETGELACIYSVEMAGREADACRARDEVGCFINEQYARQVDAAKEAKLSTLFDDTTRPN